VLELAAREIGPDWDDATQAQAFHERHKEQVRREAPDDRLVEWRAALPAGQPREEWRARAEQ
jgi:hypothetical protein